MCPNLTLLVRQRVNPPPHALLGQCPPTLEAYLGYLRQRLHLTHVSRVKYFLCLLLRQPNAAVAHVLIQPAPKVVTAALEHSSAESGAPSVKQPATACPPPVGPDGGSLFVAVDAVVPEKASGTYYAAAGQVRVHGGIGKTF